MHFFELYILKKHIMLRNIIGLIALLCALETTTAAENSRKNHRDHKNKRGLTTIDGVVYNEFVVTSTLPPVTIYSTSYWTSYWTSVLTQYSTVVLGDVTSTKTLVTPTTYAVVSSTSVATTEASSTSSQQPTTISTSTLAPSTSSSKKVTTSIDASSLLDNLYGVSETTETYFQNVSTPYYLTTVSDGTTRLYYFEDVYYDTNGTPTATQYEKYVGTADISNILKSYVSSTVYTTSTSTIQKTVTITTSV